MRHYNKLFYFVSILTLSGCGYDFSIAPADDEFPPVPIDTSTTIPTTTSSTGDDITPGSTLDGTDKPIDTPTPQDPPIVDPPKPEPDPCEQTPAPSRSCEGNVLSFCHNRQMITHTCVGGCADDTKCADYCIDNHRLLKFKSNVSKQTDYDLTELDLYEEWGCEYGCENNACKTFDKPDIDPVTSALVADEKDSNNWLDLYYRKHGEAYSLTKDTFDINYFTISSNIAIAHQNNIIIDNSTSTNPYRGPITYYNSLFGRYSAQFNNALGNTASGYYKINYADYANNNRDFVGNFKSGHTLEAIVKLNGPIDNLNSLKANFFTSHQFGGTGLVARNNTESNNTPKLGFYTYEGSGSNYDKCFLDNHKFTTDYYYHVVGVYDGQNNKARIYINGVQGSETSTSQNFAMSSIIHYFAVGADPYNETIANLAWNGEVVLARIFGEALTQAQVDLLYNNVSDALWSYNNIQQEDRRAVKVNSISSYKDNDAPTDCESNIIRFNTNDIAQSKYHVSIHADKNSFKKGDILKLTSLYSTGNKPDTYYFYSDAQPEHSYDLTISDNDDDSTLTAVIPQQVFFDSCSEYTAVLIRKGEVPGNTEPTEIEIPLTVLLFYSKDFNLSNAKQPKCTSFEDILTKQNNP